MLGEHVGWKQNKNNLKCMMKKEGTELALMFGPIILNVAMDIPCKDNPSPMHVKKIYNSGTSVH